MRLDINKSMLATATKTAQDGASAVTAAVSLLDGIISLIVFLNTLPNSDNVLYMYILLANVYTWSPSDFVYKSLLKWY